MRVINIAIIERSPLAGSAIEAALKEPDFDVVINTNNVSLFLNKAKEKSIHTPDICLFDSRMKRSVIDKIRHHYPAVKIVVYDPIVNQPDVAVQRIENFDAYIPNSVKLKQWASTLLNIIDNRSSV